ncbi:MAG: cytochrome P450 family protein [Acidimicrobiales bacterium]
MTTTEGLTDISAARSRPAGHAPTALVDEAVRSWGAHDQDDPFPLFAALRDRGPVHPVTLVDGHEAWVVVGHDEARAALNDRRLSKDMQAALADDPSVVAEGLPGPAFSRHMLNVDPPDHTRLRRLVAVAFTHRRVEALRPRIQVLVDQLLDDIEADGPEAQVDLVERFSFPLPFTVICELLGVPTENRAWLGQNLTTLLGPTANATDYARAKVASDIVVGMLRSLVELRHDQPGDDLVSALVAARDGDEQLTHDELLSTIFQLIVAGHETTTNLLGNAVVALFRHPDQLVGLRADPAKLPAAVEELMRFDGPVHHATFRYATEPVTLGGVTIPAGAQVVINLAAANRDEGRFEDAHVFDVDRHDNRHLAFGHGIHHCLGAALARAEADIALGSLLRRFPHLRPAVALEDLRWGRGDGLVLRGLTALPVVPGAARAS